MRVHDINPFRVSENHHCSDLIRSKYRVAVLCEAIVGTGFEGREYLRMTIANLNRSSFISEPTVKAVRIGLQISYVANPPGYLLPPIIYPMRFIYAADPVTAINACFQEETRL